MSERYSEERRRKRHEAQLAELEAKAKAEGLDRGEIHTVSDESEARNVAAGLKVPYLLFDDKESALNALVAQKDSIEDVLIKHGRLPETRTS